MRAAGPVLSNTGEPLDTPVTVVEPVYEYETVWRMPRALSETEIADRLVAPPALFPDVDLYFALELLEQAEKVFSYRAIGRRQR